MKQNANGSNSENWSDLESLEKKVRKEIGAFHVTKVSQAARWLERTDDLQRRHDALRNELSERLREGNLLLDPSATVNDQPPESTTEADESGAEMLGARGGKARGRECRAAYVTQQAKNGKPLTRVRGALYRNGNGVIVGIAYAMASKNTWFTEFGRLLDRCVIKAKDGNPGELREAMDILFSLLDHIDECRDNVVFFADEGGSWQLGVDWAKVLPVWFKVLTATAQPEEYARRINDMLSRHYSYGRDKMLLIACRIANPDQRKALAEVKAASKRTRSGSNL